MIRCWRAAIWSVVALGVPPVWAQDGADGTGAAGAPSGGEAPAVVAEEVVDKPAVPPATERPPSDGRPEDHEQQIARALARLPAEPSLQELERAALHQADADIESTKRWRRTPRLSAMLPTLKVTGDYDMGRDETLDRYQEKPDRWGADTDRGYGFQVSAQWHLNELVFNPDEIRTYDALLDRATRRETLLNLLIGYYFERRRLQLEEILLPPASLDDVLERRLRIRELTASINALTGGLLSRKMYEGGTRAP